MLTLHWLFTIVVAAVALAALWRARRASKRLERLSESYWELRYENGQLSARLARLEGGHEEAAARPAEGGSFVPLSSLKKM